MQQTKVSNAYEDAIETAFQKQNKIYLSCVHMKKGRTAQGAQIVWSWVTEFSVAANRNPTLSVRAERTAYFSNCDPKIGINAAATF